MHAVRRVILWLVLGAIALLAVLSIIGAFLGADRAKALFNSVPLVAYWMLLAMLLAAGFVFFRRLLKSPALLAMHLGSVLVLGGAMWGSEGAHALRRRWLGSAKVAGGVMVIAEGHRENRVLDPKTMEPVAELPFDLHLREFWIEYYEPWHLVVAAPVLDRAGRAVDERQAQVPWTVGREVILPLVGVRLTVLEYLDRAAPAFAPGAEPVLEISPPGRDAVTVPARAGQEVRLEEPPMTVRVAQVLRNLRLRGRGDQREIVDDPGEGVNPAILVEMVEPDGTTHRRYVLALVPMHAHRDPGPPMRYVFPEPVGARPEPSSRVPAMEVLLECDGRAARQWLLPRKDQRYVGVDLGPLVHATPEAADAAEATPALYLVRPHVARDWFSDLAVLEGGAEAARQVIEVNHPLHWPAPWPLTDLRRVGRWMREGGYHLYQADWDKDKFRYTVLVVSSDSGLAAVWAGMALVVAGTFGRLWVGPVGRRVVGRRGAAGAGSQTGAGGDA